MYSDVTRYLQLLLRREGYTFKTTAEFEEVRKIKVCSFCRLLLMHTCADTVLLGDHVFRIQEAFP